MRPFQRLHEQAYEHIKQMITTHTLTPGIIYSETKLADEIGISRTPIRDALQRLGQEGYIDILPSKGFTLHSLTQDDLIETYHIRCAIEGYCVRLIAQSAAEQHQSVLSSLQALLEEQRAVLQDSGSILRFCDLDQHFHTTIVAFARCEQFNGIFRNHMHRIYRFAIDSFKIPGRMQETVEEHEQIVACARKPDPHAACEATLSHMASLKNLMIDHL